MKPSKQSSEISLCSSCHCMTKTIDGNCGKCKEVKQSSETRKIIDEVFEDFRKMISTNLPNLPDEAKEFEFTYQTFMKQCLYQLKKKYETK